jgi:uracil-DNA glycosylase family 4
MISQEFTNIIEFTLQKLVEFDSMTTEEAADTKAALLGYESEEEARRRLLTIVGICSSNCTSCNRCYDKIHSVFGRGKLDVPMIVGTSPNIFDSMTSSPFTGSLEIISSRCGNCELMPQHFAPVLWDNPKSLGDTECIKEGPPTSGPIHIPLPLQNANKQILPIKTGGQILDRLLADIGHRRLEWKKPTVYITNTVLCPSKEDKDPSTAERKTCSIWLDLQIKIVRPPIVVFLGAGALHYVTKTPVVSKYAGQVHPTRDFKFGCTYHPSSILHMPEAQATDRYNLIRTHLDFYLNKFRENECREETQDMSAEVSQ